MHDLMTFIEPTDATLDREIEQLVGKKVRGELTVAERDLLARLVAREARGMRPSRAVKGKQFLRRALAR